MKFRIDVPGTNGYPGSEKNWWSNISIDEMVTIAANADSLGFDYTGVSEHIVMNSARAPTMGKRWMHCVTTLSFLAGVTKRIRLVGVIVLPYHNPIELAKALATVDVVSKGRLEVVALLGYMPWEYSLVSAVPFERRGAAMNEYIDAMTELWTSDEPQFSGEFVQFEDVVFDPKPAQEPLPLWIGGYTRPAARRLARFGYGWKPWAISRNRIVELMAYARSQPTFLANPRPLELAASLFEATYDPASHEVLSPPAPEMDRAIILNQVRELADLGVTVTDADGVLRGSMEGHGVGPCRDVTEFLDRMTWFAEEILPEAHSLDPSAKLMGYH